MSIVLIVADRAEDRQVAISRGLELAGKMGWRAQVVGFVYENLDNLELTDTTRREVKKKLLAKRTADVQAEVDKHLADVRTTVTAVWHKSIHLWIDQQCARKEYAVVIKSGHRSGTFLYTSTDWHLLRECPAPVIIAAKKKWRATRSIVAAVDLSNDSRTNRQLNDQIMSAAKRFAEHLGTRLFVVHALHIPVVLTDLDMVNETRLVQKMKAELQPKVERLAKAHDLPVSDIVVKRGPVHKVVISESARLKAQLVVMGTVGRKGVKGKLLGNTAEKVLSRLRTDVLAIKP